MTARVYTDGKRLALGAGAAAAAWIGDACMFALDDGDIVSVAGNEQARVQAHDGALLCAALHPAGDGLLTG
ncbi:MAG: hypothetical protein AB7L65_07635, partial [Hyphomonadaceae bacterium]